MFAVDDLRLVLETWPGGALLDLLRDFLVRYKAAAQRGKPLSAEELLRYTRRFKVISERRQHDAGEVLLILLRGEYARKGLIDETSGKEPKDVPPSLRDVQFPGDLARGNLAMNSIFSALLAIATLTTRTYASCSHKGLVTDTETMLRLNLPASVRRGSGFQPRRKPISLSELFDYNATIGHEGGGGPNMQNATEHVRLVLFCLYAPASRDGGGLCMLHLRQTERSLLQEHRPHLHSASA